MLQIVDKTDEEKIYDLLIWRRRSPNFIDKNEKVEIIEIPINLPNKETEIIITKIVRTEKPLPGNPIVVFGHGNGEILDDYISSSFYTPFCQHGISICAFDYRGYGYSDGQYGTCSANERQDLIYTIKYLKKLGFEKVSYFGRSLGATCGIFAASEIEDLVCLALDSPWLSTKEWVEYRARDLYHILDDVFHELIPTVFFKVKEKTGIDFDLIKEPREAALNIKQPIFIIHGTEDSIVPFSNGKELFDIVQSEVKKFKSFDGDHNDSIRYLLYKEMFDFILEQNGVNK